MTIEELCQLNNYDPNYCSKALIKLSYASKVRLSKFIIAYIYPEGRSCFTFDSSSGLGFYHIRPHMEADFIEALRDVTGIDFNAKGLKHESMLI